MWSSSGLTAQLNLINWPLVWPIAAIAMAVLLLLRVIYSVNHRRVRGGALDRNPVAIEAKWLFPFIVFMSCLIYGMICFLRQVQP